MKSPTPYLRNSFRFDLVAGFTVAMIAVPQAMAYAAIAGMPPIYGLFTAILPAIIGSLLGSSRQLITGPCVGCLPHPYSNSSQMLSKSKLYSLDEVNSHRR
jgi:MFS superfamily sulfate permease-like transporter